jgi:hypothetical protein
MYTLTPLYDSSEINSYLPSIIPYLNLALTKSPENSIDSTLYSIQQGRSLLWVLENKGQVVGCVTTKVLQHPNYRVGLIHLCGGKEVDGWVQLTLKQIEQWARDKQCHSIEIIGRKGWEKKLTGYTSDRVVYTKKLNHA